MKRHNGNRQPLLLMKNLPQRNAKPIDDIRKRARRLTLRLAHMANRCFWVSATEVAVHLQTGSDCVQTHRNQCLFTRQLQWACQECKRLLGGDGTMDEPSNSAPSIAAVTVQLKSLPPDQPRQPRQPTAQATTLNTSDADKAAQPIEQTAASDDEVSEDTGMVLSASEAEENPELDNNLEQNAVPDEVVAGTAHTSSTNAADDFSHRGKHLIAMPLYIYRMHVMRVPRKRITITPGGTHFEFEQHYVLSRNYVQKVMLDQMDYESN